VVALTIAMGFAAYRPCRSTAMAISKKHRRRLAVSGRSFLWWVYQDMEACGAMVLKVASEDKRMLVEYELDQVEDSRYLRVLGPEFPGLRYSDPALSRIRCPRFHANAAVTPGDVRRMVEWCLDSEKAVKLVNWRGKTLSPKVVGALAATAREKLSNQPLQRTTGRRGSDGDRIDHRRRGSAGTIRAARRR
jgi:hypothetical protein